MCPQALQVDGGRNSRGTSVVIELACRKRRVNSRRDKGDPQPPPVMKPGAGWPEGAAGPTQQDVATERGGLLNCDCHDAILFVASGLRNFMTIDKKPWLPRHPVTRRSGVEPNDLLAGRQEQPNASLRC